MIQRDIPLVEANSCVQIRKYLQNLLKFHSTLKFEFTLPFFIQECSFSSEIIGSMFCCEITTLLSNLKCLKFLIMVNETLNVRRYFLFFFVCQAYGDHTGLLALKFSRCIILLSQIQTQMKKQIYKCLSCNFTTLPNCRSSENISFLQKFINFMFYTETFLIAKVRCNTLYRDLKAILQGTIISEKVICNIHDSKGPP